MRTEIKAHADKIIAAVENGTHYAGSIIENIEVVERKTKAGEIEKIFADANEQLEFCAYVKAGLGIKEEEPWTMPENVAAASHPATFENECRTYAQMTLEEKKAYLAAKKASDTTE